MADRGPGGRSRLDSAGSGQHGLGIGLLADSLSMVDAEHQPAYLESTSPANDRKYADLGFEPFGEIACPGGQVITTMWRPAR